jgi:hypothetical protein
MAFPAMRRRLRSEIAGGGGDDDHEILGRRLPEITMLDVGS